MPTAELMQIWKMSFGFVNIWDVLSETCVLLVCQIHAVFVNEEFKLLVDEKRVLCEKLSDSEKCTYNSCYIKMLSSKMASSCNLNENIKKLWLMDNQRKNCFGFTFYISFSAPGVHFLPSESAFFSKWMLNAAKVFACKFKKISTKALYRKLTKIIKMKKDPWNKLSHFSECSRDHYYFDYRLLGETDHRLKDIL